ncbi:hypothetical protein HX890_08125 [Pseudomonas gingeri]|uniref:DUF6124 family protein n=1 Tax=Pseudomonas gingeri TaxID=117681 RepID=UPI0015A4CC60|nr:hypothetical protein [Pseudomonas gingeri]NWD74087.1 hypothetical protein [Pseudomonas gingeri]
MFKITPNPPGSSSIETIDPQIVDRALAHYDLPVNSTSKRRRPHATHPHATAAQSREDIIVSAFSVLESAAATAYGHADNLTGSNRKVAMGVVHLIELAQGLVDSLLDASPQEATN